MGALIVFSCDQKYFPLAKGLVLSILHKGSLPPEIGLAFVDIGCDAYSLSWLAHRGVRVRAVDEAVMGRLAHPEFGYQRSQLCRPFLPGLFPESRAFFWIDCDAWVQDISIFAHLLRALAAARGKLFIAPECHFSYTTINENAAERRRELFSYYEPVFGGEIALQMCEHATLNTGFFAMSADNPIWSEWEVAVKRIYLNNPDRYAPAVRHMAEQTALNVVAARSSRVTLLDPLYNYLSLWTLPFRDEAGIVRIALPPNLPVGVVHLAGGWRYFGQKYFDERLLFSSGDYLTAADVAILFPQERDRAYR